MDEVGFEHRCPNGEISISARDALVDRAGGLTHLEPEVPEQIEHVFYDLLPARSLLVGQQKKQIDIGIGRHLAAAVTAHGDQRQAVRCRRVGLRVDNIGDMGVNVGDELVDQKGSGCRSQRPVGFRLETAPDLRAASFQRLFEQRQHIGAFGRGLERSAQGLMIDDFALVSKPRHLPPYTSRG